MMQTQCYICFRPLVLSSVLEYDSSSSMRLVWHVHKLEIHSCDQLCCYYTLRWMEACLNEELPAKTELEEGLRNGVYLAKLGNFFSPKVVSVKKIYDREQTRYKVSAVHHGYFFR